MSADESHGSLDLNLFDENQSGRHELVKPRRPSSRRLSSHRHSRMRIGRRSKNKRRLLLGLGGLGLISLLTLAFFGARQLLPTGPGCGNHVIDAGEDCDDGNQVDTDVCTNMCTSNIAYFTVCHRENNDTS